MVPPAPAVFSTTTDWPRVFDIPCASPRPTRSVGPPAVNGTTIVMGFEGKAWAQADDATAVHSAAAARRRIIFIVVSLLRCRRADRRRPPFVNARLSALRAA